VGSRPLPRALGEKRWRGEREDDGGDRCTLKWHGGRLHVEEMEGGRYGALPHEEEKGGGLTHARDRGGRGPWPAGTGGGGSDARCRAARGGNRGGRAWVVGWVA
jgi:hypothetical protein